ncbi:FtsW/RodA/SpoVE family cell cycle protein [Dactylococcopsis salina]|uniref:Probable peptidoglycan glycosyltransferase FtsW n=1 Tax=Dactylococcopsis salina (strain PCC 8305) TaxID=13035 RepID=K9YYH6_DACS8|nr:FtsW/RodA/SpoVE family cell cycle protein [Dactylococcopsis salina]AFZ51158.1 bacterial cell division membrane protein [Dactylococcopsis salina PCC 8305]
MISDLMVFKYLIPFFPPEIESWATSARLLRWLTFVWLLIGLVVLFSASYAIANDEFGDGLYYVKRQVIWAYVGLLLFNLVTRISLTRWLKIAPFALILLLVLVITTKFAGVTVNGAKRWLAVGPLLLQPSELIKPFLVLQSAIVFGNWYRLKPFGRVFWLTIFAMVLGGILIQPDLSNTALCGMSLWLIALAGVIRWRYLIMVAASGVGLAALSITFQDYQRQRVISFLDPWAEAQGDGYQLTQSLMAIGSGGISGTGLGLSQQKLFYLPIQYTDFIFAVYAEEFGFVGCVVLLSLIMSFTTVALIIASQALNAVHRLIAVGAVIFLVGQSLINIGVATGSLPTTGLPFPLFSYGGNSVLASLFLAGLLVRVARENHEGNVVEFPSSSRR